MGSQSNLKREIMNKTLWLLMIAGMLLTWETGVLGEWPEVSNTLHEAMLSAGYDLLANTGDTLLYKDSNFEMAASP